MAELIEINTYPVINVLAKLLQDKTTGKNIIYGTDYYLSYGCSEKAEMSEEALRSFGAVDIQPRVKKAQAQQSERTRSKAEVFTPTWIVKKMNDHCDSVWREGKYANDWKKYVQLRVLEITCGEAPFLVTRYDTTTGEPIPIAERTGILDRKLKAIQADDEETWLKWANIAFESTYGYEFQGDNLFIARINLLVTFCDYLKERWNREAKDSELKHITNTIVWNTWQMDGLNDTVPLGEAGEEFHQFSLFDDEGPVDLEADSCKIYNHRSGKSFLFSDIKEGKSNMRFDFVIGNPPYQDTTESDTTRMPPIYHFFMDAAYSVADRVELITPARFLFNAGQTPKAWNQKMLEDPHFKVLFYEPDASTIFKNTDIKGGVAISYRDANEKYGAIRVFVSHSELRSILQKAGAERVEDSLTDIADSSNVYDLKNIYADHPDYTKYIGDGGRHSQLKTNVLDINPIFTDMPTENDDYKVLGLVSGKRGQKYCHRRYIKSDHKSLYKYKALVPKAAGSGKFGDAFPEMMIAQPNVAFTQTFISIGTFDNEIEVVNLIKYIKTKFCRALLFVLKVTQDNLPSVWRCIPKQNFTPTSDIDWSKSIAEIDKQLYAKYGLTQEEIDFIESHVKEME